MRPGASTRLLAALVLALSATTPDAKAAPASRPTAKPVSPAPVVPPRLISSAEVPYPPAATSTAGEALVVVLEMTVAADGAVRSAHAISGGEPFAGAAVDAALTWRFEPATREGKAVTSVIRFQLTFHPPEAREPEAASPAAPATSSSTPEATPPRTTAPKPPTPSRGAEVVVHGVYVVPAPAVSSFSKAEIRQLPGAFGDPFRAIEALPGVTPIVSGLPFFYVRGAPPGNVGYFFDGVRVPYLYHVGLGPSVIHPGMVDRVDLYPGGYPARYGRFAGGIVTGDATAPRDDFHGEGNIRLFDAGALAEGGFAGGRGTVLIGGRYSYTATILSLIVKDTKLDYRDYQGRVTYDLTPHDRVSAFTFGSYDLLAQTAGNVQTVVFGSEFYRLDLRYDHSFGADSTVRFGVTLGYDQTRFLDQRNFQDQMVSTRVELRHPVKKGVVLRAGADLSRDGFTTDKSSYIDPDDPPLRILDSQFPSRTDLALGAWSDLVLDVAPRIQITPGVRFDVFSSGSTTTPSIDPRISARFAITDRIRIIHAYGIAHQTPGFIAPFPGLTPGNLRGGLQTSLQASAGVETDLPEAITATATVFDNVFLNMSDIIGTSQGDLLDNVDKRALGSAVGFELFVRRNLSKRLGGFLTYTLSRSTRSLGAERFPSAFDRTHVANAALAYNLGRNWRAGTRLVFYTGGPKIISYRGATPPPPSQSPDRDPPFYRVDLRIEKRWNYGKSRWLALVLECLNATLNKETVQGQAIGPVTIPSIGLEGGI